jgi:hypothetical protein
VTTKGNSAVRCPKKPDTGTDEHYNPVHLGILESNGMPTAEAVALLQSIADCPVIGGEQIFSTLESPIERMFLLSFYRIQGIEYPEEVRVSSSNVDFIGIEFCFPRCTRDDNGEPVRSPEYVVRVFPQYTIESCAKEYRVDFLLFASDQGGTTKGIAVEVDGHDFHEKTREQVISDNMRDRELLKRGFPVIRFSGSEVFTSPNSCVISALNVLFSIFGEGGVVEEVAPILSIWGREDDESPPLLDAHPPQEPMVEAAE